MKKFMPILIKINYFKNSSSQTNTRINKKFKIKVALYLFKKLKPYQETLQ